MHRWEPRKLLILVVWTVAVGWLLWTVRSEPPAGRIVLPLTETADDTAVTGGTDAGSDSVPPVVTTGLPEASAAPVIDGAPEPIPEAPGPALPPPAVPVDDGPGPEGVDDGPEGDDDEGDDGPGDDSGEGAPGGGAVLDAEDQGGDDVGEGGDDG